MRLGKGCNRCRHRHIRCVIITGASICTTCDRLGRVCIRDPHFKFKTVKHVYQKRNGIPVRFDLIWHTEQTWVHTKQPVTFVSQELHTSEKDEVEDEDEYSDIQQTPEINPTAHLDRIAYNSSPTSPSYTSHAIGADSHLTPLSLREASLLRYFIQNISPWADVCDPQSHFKTVVPQRALEVRMILKAILSFSARHDAILNERSDWEACSYHSQCLELLINALDQPEYTYDENLLITVVILRMYEELEINTDQKCHLLGSNRLVNLMSRSASCHGLAEAVSWQFLRQAIYACIVQYQPLQLNLQNYQKSSMFQRDDEAAYANFIIYHCAYILQASQHRPRQPVNIDDWHQMVKTVEDWHQEKPSTWQPLRYMASSIEADQPFAEIWMMSAPAVIGLQYYHTAWVFLTLADPTHTDLTDYEMAHSQHVAERTIATHIKTVVGLSLSNESVPNAYFMACHLLHRFGYCLRHPVEQKGALDFLRRAERALGGWRTTYIRRGLENQWTELALDT